MVADVVAAAMAHEVWRRDAQLDEMYTQFFRALLTYMMEDPRRVATWLQLVFMAGDIERVGDHATNIAEMVRYLLGGQLITEERPKADITQTIVASEPRVQGDGLT
jgi:phosphate transport system protein